VVGEVDRPLPGGCNPGGKEAQESGPAKWSLAQRCFCVVEEEIEQLFEAQTTQQENLTS
jgi:hypothetical protein